jgi:hypothetical protein
VTELEELTATIAVLTARVASLETRVPSAPRAGLLQMQPEGATVTEYLDHVPALPAASEVDRLFENTLREHPELVLDSRYFKMSELRVGFAAALRYVASRGRLAVVDKSRNLRDWHIICENWHIDRHESSGAITGPAFLLAVYASGIPVEIGRDVFKTYLGISEKAGQTAPVQRSAAA